MGINDEIRDAQIKTLKVEAKLENYRREYQVAYIYGVNLARALHKVTKKACKDIYKIKNITAQLTLEQYDAININLKEEKYSLNDIDVSLRDGFAIRQASRTIASNQKTSAKAWQFANSSIENLPGLGGVFLASTGFIFSSISQSREARRALQTLAYQEAVKVTEIGNVRKQITKTKAILQRIDEIGLVVTKGLEAFNFCYNDIYKKLYPNGNISKIEREKRKVKGGLYFSNEEFKEIIELGKTAAYLLKMLKSEL
jgi:hypothetical protein